MSERCTVLERFSSPLPRRMALPIRAWSRTAKLPLATRNWQYVLGIFDFTQQLTDYSSWTTWNRPAKIMVSPWFIAARYRIILTVFVLDKHHRIETGKQFPVCGNTWRMLHDTRFAAHFDFYGNFERHYGIFPGCGMGLPYDDDYKCRPTNAQADAARLWILAVSKVHSHRVVERPDRPRDTGDARRPMNRAVLFSRMRWMSCGSTPALPVTWPALSVSKAPNQETIACNCCGLTM